MGLDPLNKLLGSQGIQMEAVDVLKMALNPSGYLIEKMMNKNAEAFDAESENSPIQKLKEYTFTAHL